MDVGGVVKEGGKGGEMAVPKGENEAGVSGSRAMRKGGLDVDDGVGSIGGVMFAMAIGLDHQTGVYWCLVDVEDVKRSKTRPPFT